MEIAANVSKLYDSFVPSTSSEEPAKTEIKTEAVSESTSNKVEERNTAQESVIKEEDKKEKEEKEEKEEEEEKEGQKEKEEEETIKKEEFSDSDDGNIMF